VHPGNSSLQACPQGDGTRRAAGGGQRILIVTADVLGVKLAGPAIRAWQMAEALSASHQVVLLSTEPPCERQSPRFEVTDRAASDVSDLAAWCDLMIIQGFVLEFCPELRHHTGIIVVDYYDALHFETLELVKAASPAVQAGAVRAAVNVLDEQARRGDFFVCSSERQRDLWLGHLAANGRINPATYGEDPNLSQLLAIVPFGVPDDPPVRPQRTLRGVHPAVPEEAELLIWAGGIYDWLDPLTLISAVARLAPTRPALRLFFLGVRHPNPAAIEPAMVAAARKLARDLGVLDRVVVFNDEWVDYADRQNYLLEADIGVSAHAAHLETEFSFRTRILDYLWTGLPVVTNSGDELARIVNEAGCGRIVEPGDPQVLAGALDALLDDPIARAECSARSSALGQRYRWSQVLKPLIDFCADPRRAADHVGIAPAPPLKSDTATRGQGTVFTP
jgi:glycosyltransferase involved in cell wall biosynthesis